MSGQQSEILALVKVEVGKIIALTDTAIKHEESNQYEKAIMKYGDAVKLMYNVCCFLSGVALRKTTIKFKNANESSRGQNNTIDFDRSFIVEKIANKIIQIYDRMQRLDNVVSSGRAETYSLMNSIDIPLDLNTNDTNMTTTSLYDSIKDVLVKIQMNETDTFAHIIGHQFTKEKLVEIAHTFTLNIGEYTKNILNNRFVTSNAMIILYGPPGTGKTSLVRALAAHMNVPLYEMKLSALFNKYVGETEKKMTAVFDWALSSTEAKIIFIDELDSMFSKRGAGNEESIDKKIKTIFMTEMNRFNTTTETNILIIGATNLIDDIDEAIKRRSMLNIEVKKPTEQSDYEILIRHEFQKFKLNYEAELVVIIAKMAMERQLSQSKIVDIVKKLLALVTSRLTAQIYIVRNYNEGLENVYSLNGKSMSVNDGETFTIVETNQEGAIQIELNSAESVDIVDKIVLPFITVAMWAENQAAFVERAP